MFISKQEQLALAKEFQKHANVQMARLQFMYDELFYVDSAGNKLPKPSTTLIQLNLIKEKLLEIDAIYKQRISEFQVLEKEREEVNNNANNTKSNIVAFFSKYDIEIPKILKQLYRI